MGIFDFVKGAGKKIFGKDDEPAAEETSAEPEVNHARQAYLRQQKELNEEAAKASTLTTMLEQHGFDMSRVNLQYDIQQANGEVFDEVVTLAGSVDTQQELEVMTLLVGNVDGVSKVDAQIEVTNPEPPATFYTVEKGDNLSKISKHFYGEAKHYRRIFEANTPMLKDPDKIYPGQVLRIPMNDQAVA